jgi:hypothetical protein
MSASEKLLVHSIQAIYCPFPEGGQAAYPKHTESYVEETNLLEQLSVPDRSAVGGETKDSSGPSSWTLDLTATLSRKQYIFRYDDFTTVHMKINIFWNITPCSPFKDNRLLGGSYHLHLHSKLLAICFIPVSTWLNL